MGCRWARLPYRTRVFEYDQRFWWIDHSRWGGNVPANGGCHPGAAAGRANRARIERITQRSRGSVGGPGTKLHPPVARRTEPERGRPWNIASERRRGDESVSRSRRPLLPGVMSLRARWRRRRARAHLMNELLAAMDTPSRLDREDRVSAPRPVTRCTGSAGGTNARLSGAPTPPAALSYQPVAAKHYTGNR
jgi:hypothetical protein